MTGPGAFRAAAGQFASGIVVVTTAGGHAMTVSAFTSVSLEPPLVLFCAEKIARFHDAVLAAGEWAVSILPAGSDAEKTASWLATRGRPMTGQLDGIPHHPGAVTGAPLLDGALATLECRTTAAHDGGDHTIIVGQVESTTAPAADPATSVTSAPSAPSDRSAASAPSAALAGPLIHYAGAYHRLPATRPETGASDEGSETPGNG